MASNNRARTRAIRAQMAESGENYTRAAHSVSGRPARHLRAVCFGCRRDIPDGGGLIHISNLEVSQVERARTVQQERARQEAVSMAELLAGPEDARWQVHCDDCNPHRDNDCEGCYAFAVERCRTWPQLVDWTAHLCEKSWVIEATDWLDFIRTTAQGTSDVGLICDPADRYYGA